MANLSKAQEASVKEMKIGSGVPFVIDSQKADLIPNNSYLIVGLGGTGIMAALETKALINRTCKVSGKNALPDNVGVLAIDTDGASLETLRSSLESGSLPFDPKEKMGIPCADVKSILSRAEVHRMPAYIKSWLDQGLIGIEGITAGAGGYRQIGRLMLMLKIDEVIAKMETMIHQITKNTSNRLVVFVVHGIGGGTGSGTFLDIGYLIRKVVAEKKTPAFALNETEIFDYLVMPDVSYENHPESYIYRNGYAALKELDYMMGIRGRGEWFEQSYGNKPNYRVCSNEPPFDRVHLLSGKNEAGFAYPKADKHVRQVIAENIVAFMTMQSKNPVDANATVSSVYSNLRTETDSFVAALPKNDYSYLASHDYLSLGCATFEIPIDKILLYLTYLLFQKMDEMYERVPDKADVMDFVAVKWRADHDSVLSDLASICPYSHESSKNAFSDFIEAPSSGIERLNETFISNATAELEAAIAQQYTGICENFERAIHSIFEAGDLGPVYASRLINYDAVDSYCLRQYYLDIIQNLQTESQALLTEIVMLESNTIPQLKNQRPSLGMFGKDKIVQTYLAAVNRLNQCRFEEIRCRALIHLYEDINSYINDKNEKIFSLVSKILESLRDLFEENAGLLTAVKTVEEGKRTVLSWERINVPDISSDLKSIVDNNMEADLLIDKFAKAIAKNFDAWTKNSSDYAEFLKDFISNEFDEAVSLSMESWLKTAMKNLMKKDINDQDLQAQITDAGGLGDQLGQRSMPLLSPTASFTAAAPNATYRLISYPAACLNLDQGFKNYALAKGINADRLMQSLFKYRISFTSMRYGLPLYADSMMETYEKTYEDSLLGGMASSYGLHLIRQGDVNWRELPAVYRESAWPTTYRNKYTRDKNRENRDFFALLEERGISYYDAAQSSYIFPIVQEPDYEQILSALEKPDTLTLPLLEKIKAELSAWRSPRLPKIDATINDQFSIRMEEGIDQAERDKNKKATVESFIYYYDLIRRMKEEVKKYDRYEQAMKRIDESLLRLRQEAQAYRYVIQGLMTDIFKQVPNQKKYACLETDRYNEDWLVYESARTRELALLDKIKQYFSVDVLSHEKQKWGALKELIDEKIVAFDSDAQSGLEAATATLQAIEKNYQAAKNQYELSGEEKEAFESYQILRKEIQNQKDQYDMS